MKSQPVIMVSNLTKFYGDFKALDSVSFSVNKGWIYGYLGPNGAGKTTIMGASVGPCRPENFFPRRSKVCTQAKNKEFKIVLLAYHKGTEEIPWSLSLKPQI